MSELPIKKLGPYRIEGIVGRGGMGSVFAATHAETGENAAIKVLSPAMASDETFRERFVAEIDSLKTLNHPNIVTLHGYGESDGHLYYAMELVDGTNLQEELQRGRRFTWREVTQIGIDMSRALKHAHDHGVIHRDMKPANLLLDRKDDQIKLTDFGIAKLFGATSQTFGGSVMGTADYMAPEQAAGEATTPRCDLYSLGCVMYALLAGTPPFQGKNIAEVVHKVRYERAPPLSKYTTDVPVDLQQIIDELLEKNPADRIRTALSLSHRLKSMQQALSISTTEKDEFSSDEESAVSSKREQTNRIVNPPPDIAERKTVYLPSNTETASNKANTEAKAKSETKQLDHFTRVELRQARASESSRSSEFSSAVPLLLMLLTVLGGLMGGVWYSTLPREADDLHARILAGSEDETKLLNVSKDVNEFVERFPDEPRIEGIKALQLQIKIRKLQRTLESKAKRRKETGKLSPIEEHCLEAMRFAGEGNLEKAIGVAEGTQMFFGDAGRSNDIQIRQGLQLLSKLRAQWTKELQDRTDDLLANLEVYADRARNQKEEDPQRALAFWSGVLKLYDGKPWAAEYVSEARVAIGELSAKAALPKPNAAAAMEDAPYDGDKFEGDKRGSDVEPISNETSASKETISVEEVADES